MMEDFKPLIKNSNFRYLWISQILSQVTINIMNFILLVKLLSETGSTIATSMLWVAYAIPAILVGPIAAASIDMLDKRKILIYTNLLQSSVILLYALSHTTAVFSLYGLAFLYSLLNQFYVPSEQASLPGIVKQKNLAHANGLFFITQQSAIIAGFGIAGFLNHFIGFKNTLFLGSFLIFIAFISVTFLKTKEVKTKISWRLDESIIKFFNTMIDGYRFIRQERKVLMPLLILLGFSASLSIVMVNVPVIARDIFEIPANLAGIVVVVPAGIGTAIGSVLVPRLLKKGVRKKTVIEESLFTLIFSLLLVNILTIFVSSIPRIVIGVTAIVIVGFSFVGVLIPSQTFLQEKTPEDFRGRVFGNFWFLSTIVTVLPMMFAGVIAEYLGIRVLLFLLSVVLLYPFVFSKAKGQTLLKNNI